MLISERQLRDVTHLLLQKAGSQADEARCVSDHLVNANLKGHDSHGVGMLPHYVAFIAKGIMHPNTPVRLLLDGGAVLQFIGDRGFGQRTGKEAMEQAIARAKPPAYA